MDPNPQPPALDGRPEAARALLVVQAAVAALNTAEVAVLALLGSPAPAAGTLPLSAATALALLALARGVARGARGARRAALVVESLLLLLAAADELVAVAVHRPAPLLVPVLVRVVLPLGGIALPRRPAPGPGRPAAAPR